MKDAVNRASTAPVIGITAKNRQVWFFMLSFFLIDRFCAKIFPLRGDGVAVTHIHTNRESESHKVLMAFAKSIQERDIVTYEHSRRVATYAQRLARYLGWSRREAHNLALAALVHDLGKTWIGNEILNKSGVLSLEERRTMQRHPIIGARILIGCDVDSFFINAVLYHHEAWDGHGYPAGLKGEEIPLSARILTIADVYDVLTSQRPYKAPLSNEAARERLVQDSARSFDPRALDAFVRLLDTNPHFTLPQHICSYEHDDIPHL
jgi:putative two-component system response regulator